jgi:glutamate synthase (NADPH/NADH) small chain
MKEHYQEPSGFTYEEALAEAQRCLNCKHKPCVTGCVAHMEIPSMIQAFLNNDGSEARRISSSYNNFSEICGRVCYQDQQCQGSCVYAKLGKPIQIGKLERFINDTYELPKIEYPQLSGKVAIIGSGPAGLSCAYDCAQSGLHVTIFERSDQPGGVLRHGIPIYRLPKIILDQRIDELLALNVTFKLNRHLGLDFTLDSLRKHFDAVLLAVGAQEVNTVSIPGSELPQVIQWDTFLRTVNDGKAAFDSAYGATKRVLVVGGGNVAMDVCNAAARWGKSVTLVYRRTQELMPARPVEVEEVLAHGIDLQTLRDPIAILKNGETLDVLCKITQLVSSEEDPRGKIVDGVGSQTYETDLVVLAIGSSVTPIQLDGLTLDSSNKIVTDDQQRTSLSWLYAAGDAVTGPKTVVHALSAGKRAAKAICEALAHD